MRPNVSDQLANERTFLAYLRTALAFIGFGFVIARFGLFLRESQAFTHTAVRGSANSTPLGLVMVGVGVAVAVFGLFRYAAVAQALAKGGTRELSVRAAGAIVAMLAIFGAVVAYALFQTSSV